MKKAFSTLLLLTGLVLSGCHNGSTPVTTTVVYTWTSDGNPNVPTCGTVLKNCLSSYTILDVTLGKTQTLSLGTFSYTAPNPNDPYELRVNGYDGQGNQISSVYDSTFMTAHYIDKLAPTITK